MASWTAEVKDTLRSAGCYFERQGKGDHEIWYSPHSGKNRPGSAIVSGRSFQSHKSCRPGRANRLDIPGDVRKVNGIPYTGSGAAFIRSMLKRLLTLRSGTAAISLR